MISLPHDDDVKITEKQKADATAADAAETVAAEKVKAEAATVAVEKAARYICHDPRGRSNLYQRNYVRGGWQIATVD